MIHPSALVSPKAQLGRDVAIGPFTIVHEAVIIGDGTTIGSHCEIGHPSVDPDEGPLVIGANSVIRSHCVFYRGSRFGEGLNTGHHVTVRERAIVGKGLQIGMLCDVQGRCEIGDFVRLLANVHVAQGSRVGSYTWLFPYVVLTNDPHPPSEIRQGVTVEEYAVIATMSVLLPGVTVGCGAFVGANTRVARDVAADTIVAGVPAKVLGPTSRLRFRDGSRAPVYPWRRHFHRGFPEEVVREWIKEFSADE